jgi:hypothetical protein
LAGNGKFGFDRNLTSPLEIAILSLRFCGKFDMFQIWHNVLVDELFEAVAVHVG